MAYTYTSRNGERVEVAVASAFDAMAAEFKRVFGVDLIVTSGTRTRAEQQRLYDLYRAGKGNLAAPPGSSNHEENGPRGPRALDLRDSGRDRGVTYSGTTRSNWLRNNCGRWGFVAAGFKFSQVEPWHYEFNGTLGQSAPAPSGNSSSLKATDMLRWRWNGIQEMLKGAGYGYSGAIDGIPGKGTITAFQKFIKNNGYRNVSVDGVWGPETAKGAQSWLKARWGYTGAIDALPGGGTKAAWDRAEAANARAF